MSSLHFVCRTLSRSPGFAFIAALTIAIGIGASTALYSVIDAVLLRRLAAERPEELMLLSPKGYFPGSQVNDHGLSYPEYQHLRDGSTAFSGLICRFQFTANVGRPNHAERVSAELISGNYFSTLGVGAALGRTIGAEDDRQPGAHPVVVLSYEYWVTRFGARPDVLGQPIHVNGQILTIIGVSAQGFRGVELDHCPAVRVPIAMAERMIPHLSWIKLSHPHARWVEVIGRLPPGVSRAEAQSELQPLHQQSLDPLAAALNTDDRSRLRASSLELLPAQHGISELRGDWTAPLGALTVMVGLVLALTCVNLANLHMARGAQREGELALRMALGAGRGRVIGQLVGESMVLAGCGAAAGLLVASSLAEISLPFIASRDDPANLSVAIDWGFFVAGLALTTVVVLVAGLAPAVLSTRLDLTRVLRRSAVLGGTGARLRRMLVAAQLSLSLVLLIGSALFLRSLRQLNRIDPGFRTEDVAVFGFDAVLNGSPRARIEADYERLRLRLEQVPGIGSVAFGMVRVIDGSAWISGVAVRDSILSRHEPPVAALNAVSPDYFQTLGIPLVSGREFNEADRASSAPVVIVNEAFARRFFGHDDVIGRRFGVPDPRGLIDVEIVGIVRDAKYDSLVGTTPAQLFLPHQQLFTTMSMNCYVRSTLPMTEVTKAIRTAVREIDPTVPIHALRSLREQRDLSLSRERLLALVATGFAALATLLAAIGLYGLLSFTVTRRMRELGLRMALGASTREVLGVVLRETAALLGTGMAVGLALALALGRLLAHQLPGIAPHDPPALFAASLLLAILMLAAAAVPAHRATRVNPVEALRSE